MNNQSASSFNKISIEMDRLSYLINKEQIFRQQLQAALHQEYSSSQSSERKDALEQFFQEYDNSTTKSIPFQLDRNSQDASFQPQEHSSNTLHRNCEQLQIWDAEESKNHDEMSTIIMPFRNPSKMQTSDEPKKNLKEQPQPRIHKAKVNNCTKLICPYASNATTSMPSQKHDYERKGQYDLPKNSSLFKEVQKDDISESEEFKNRQQFKLQNGHKTAKFFIHQPDKDYEKCVKGKVSKINRDELLNLQVKKLAKKSQVSTNRKKMTKRELVNNKSLNLFVQTAKAHNNYTSVKTSAVYIQNSSCKALDKKKNKPSIKQSEEKPKVTYHQQQLFKSIERTNKKLNRVNICKLQESIKKTAEKKPLKDVVNSRKEESRSENIVRNKKLEKDKPNPNLAQLQLHFTENQSEGVLHKIISEKKLQKQYHNLHDNYEEAYKKISKSYLKQLDKECSEPTEEAILKIKIIGLILCFFDQFSFEGFSKNFRKISEQEILACLEHPERILNLMGIFPKMMEIQNFISEQIYLNFAKEFAATNEQLDQELEFFLIKKTKIYLYVHRLHEYVSFLVNEKLVQETKRTKILTPQQNSKIIQGFYSNRSKRQNKRKRKSLKKLDSNLDNRCDSDRKMTVEDEDLANYSCKTNRKTDLMGKGVFKKIYK